MRTAFLVGFCMAIVFATVSLFTCHAMLPVGSKTTRITCIINTKLWVSLWVGFLANAQCMCVDMFCGKGWKLVDVAQVHVSLTIIVFVNQHVWAALAAGFLWFCVFLW